jgi:hypothetical protein
MAVRCQSAKFDRQIGAALDDELAQPLTRKNRGPETHASISYALQHFWISGLRDLI